MEAYSPGATERGTEIPVMAKSLNPPRLNGRKSTLILRITAAAKDIAADREIRLTRAFGLSDREVEIALMMYEGFTNRQISVALKLSEGTTRNYVSAIYEKTNAQNSAEAIAAIRSVLS